MKILKKKNYTGNTRKIENDDRTEFVGIIGTVGELISENLFIECDAEPGKWAFINPQGVAIFRNSREEVLEAMN